MSAWTFQPRIEQGWFLRGNVVAGTFLEFPALTIADYTRAIMGRARGWEVVGIDFERGVFGVGHSFFIYGRVTSPVVNANDVSEQISGALNSLWRVFGASVVVEASRAVVREEPKPSTLERLAGEAGSTVKWAAIAVIVAAIAWMGFSFKKG